MKKYFFIPLVALLFFACESPLTSKKDSFVTVFETSEGKETPTYPEVIEFYKELANSYSSVSLQTMGPTDSGYPLHMVVYNPNGDFNFVNLREEGKRILMINNGIHPGESDGIDATMLLIRNLAQEQIEIPKNTVIVAIPVYNIGGALNRNSHTRANQNGPEAYGFRGNAQNYDLNRDFIKMDSKNAASFAAIFHQVKPDVFIDNHVSNGANYQYTLTHLFTQHNKLQGSLGNYLHTEFMPALIDSLKQKELPITPYVNVFNQTPEVGFQQFMDYPRYSTGYTTLWNTLGMMVETHMLKPYKQRVEGTYELMKSLLAITDKQAKRIGDLRAMAANEIKEETEYPVQWEVDSTKYTEFNFKGFEADTLVSEVTGYNRLKYDRERPFERPVKYYNYFKPTVKVAVPEAYVIPQGWYKIIEKLKANKIEMRTLEEDTTGVFTYYHIDDFETMSQPFEGHYMHSNTIITAKTDSITFRKGDVIIKVDQPGKRYLLETLEPAAPDSFFNWNFFDPILQQKEHFSPYVFEDIASELLEKDAELKSEFLATKEQDTAFAENWYTQLSWIYKHSDYYEKSHLRYPIYRIEAAE
ncbi:Zinc carboxypeptidase [Pustulibacterium marinum]|uniref:Zinc carboxypeptidase n=1 Tax=Pustulibacterium marinum TaxID=1224947 RepID=A0A1I7HP93_9FLAO|nr:M14 family metallopeptidase [Pustulibacterium marinum]SFU62565.1 Zinc carboxypeptidase [Pustulibacterium marinum]